MKWYRKDNVTYSGRLFGTVSFAIFYASMVFFRFTGKVFFRVKTIWVCRRRRIEWSVWAVLVENASLSTSYLYQFSFTRFSHFSLCVRLYSLASISLSLSFFCSLSPMQSYCVRCLCVCLCRSFHHTRLAFHHTRLLVRCECVCVECALWVCEFFVVSTYDTGPFICVFMRKIVHCVKYRLPMGWWVCMRVVCNRLHACSFALHMYWRFVLCDWKCQCRGRGS